MKIKNLSDLIALRRLEKLQFVEIDADNFLEGNLPFYIIKYALWACKANGLVTVTAISTVKSVTLVTGKHSFQLLTQTFCKAAKNLGEIIEYNIDERKIIFKRTKDNSINNKWSAAIMFSGITAELEQLEKCINGLRAQPELNDDGQIAVCGPSHCRDFVVDNFNVEYIIYEPEIFYGRLMICRKKNYAIAHLKNERILICHTRIVLRPGSLASMPAEFDVCTPSVYIKNHKQELPYLDLGFVSLKSENIAGGGVVVPAFYNRKNWMKYLKIYKPYIDGGIFCVSRSLALKMPMADVVAWGEAEDVEWSLRLLNSGHIVELILDSSADSITCKMPKYKKYGHTIIYRIGSKIKKYVMILLPRLCG